MHDSGVEDRLRTAFHGEAEDLGLTITAAELERRLVARRRARTGRGVSLLAAAIAIVAVGAIAALSNGWLRLPSVAGPVESSPMATPVTTDAPVPSDPSPVPAGFTPPKMDVSVATLGQPGETLPLSTTCYSFELADGQTGTIRCAIVLTVPCCEKLDVPWGSDLTFTVPDGWSIDRSEIDSTGMTWVDDRTAPSRTITGWRSTGDETIWFDGTFSKGGDTFSGSFGVAIHGPVAIPSVAPPSTACDTPAVAPEVRLVREGAEPVVGTFGSSAWRGDSSSFEGDPRPEAAVRVAVGEALSLVIDHGACAISWKIEYGPPPEDSDQDLSVERVGSLVILHRVPPEGGPTGFANRFELAPLPAGEWFIEAQFGYADGDAAVGWHVIVR